jgi:hypothetical protein
MDSVDDPLTLIAPINRSERNTVPLRLVLDDWFVSETQVKSGFSRALPRNSLAVARLSGGYPDSFWCPRYHRGDTSSLDLSTIPPAESLGAN